MKPLRILIPAIACVIFLLIAAALVYRQPNMKNIALADRANLKFRSDGTFKIIQLADLQEAYYSSPIVREFLYGLAEKERPDLFVLTGDNIASNPIKWWGVPAISRLWVKTSINGYMNVFDRIYKDFGIPVTMVFGNHDAEIRATSRRHQFDIYAGHKSFVGFTTDADIGTSDGQGEYLGTHNLLIRGSESSQPAFNLWLFDSGSYDPRGGYGCVQQPQLDWFNETNEALGHLPSVAFQHIIVPEVYDHMTQTDENDKHSYSWTFVGDNGEEYTKYISRTLPAGAGGVMDEAPCPGKYNDGQFEALERAGNVIALFVGHEHVNTFELRREGVDLVNSPASGFGSYGTAHLRGARAITLYEENPGDYDTEVVFYKDFYPDTWTRRARLNMYNRMKTSGAIADAVSFKPLLWIMN